MVESMVERLSKQAQEDPEELRRRQEQAKQDLQDGKNIGKLLGEEVTRVENLAVPADPMLQADTGRRPVREWSDTLAAGSRASRRISRAI